MAITGRNQKTLDAAAKEIGDEALAIQSDAGKVADIEATMKQIAERFGRIDALFVNAGVAKLVPFEQVTEELFDETVRINLKGVFFTVQKTIPLMSKDRQSCSSVDQRPRAHAWHNGVRRQQSRRIELGQNPLSRVVGKRDSSECR